MSVGCELGPSMGARTRTWAEVNVRPNRVESAGSRRCVWSAAERRHVLPEESMYQKNQLRFKSCYLGRRAAPSAGDQYSKNGKVPEEETK